MVKPTRTTYPTGSKGLHWQLTDDGSRTLWHEFLDETYHSGSGAVVESWEVYLKNSGVFDRLSQGKATAVLEYGFGTGTAFLLTAATAILHRTQLRYRALELSLLPAAILADLKLNADSLEARLGSGCIGVLDIAQRLVAELADWRSTLPSDITPGIYSFEAEAQVELELVVGDAAGYRSNGDAFDAVYFDPFSPETCPTLWTRVVFESVFEALRGGGTCTSYCVKSAVRHELANVGFQVDRLKGPRGGKREVLRATKPNVT